MDLIEAHTAYRKAIAAYDEVCDNMRKAREANDHAYGTYQAACAERNKCAADAAHNDSALYAERYVAAIRAEKLASHIHDEARANLKASEQAFHATKNQLGNTKFAFEQAAQREASLR